MPTTGAFNGRSLGVFYNNTLIAYGKSCSLSLKSNVMDITSKDSLAWSYNLPSTKDWSVSCDGLVALNSSWNAVKLMDALTAGTKVTVKFSTHATGTRVTGDLFWWGSAYITSCDLNAGMDEPVSFTATFQGTSTLTKSTNT
jgi:predicted secreted protein